MAKVSKPKSRHCYFIIKNGKPNHNIPNSDNLPVSEINIKYNYFDCPTTDIIVEASILFTDKSSLLYNTIISLIHFPEKRESIEFEISVFMGKMKFEFEKHIEEYLKLNCTGIFKYNSTLDKDLKFDSYKFSPPFSPKLLQEFDY
ncbi:MAG TPA: hypothetical protein PKD16_09650 [Saprospiraceae bacterium]|jgi:hypothetical protein|nr:hypothetical protein [Saprospiraceae bacterium]HMT53675.1 hypothetical protein [Saprospiraceae bacterium]HMT70413.1 hypothetical protein [Saprospiraceae bacterium]